MSLRTVFARVDAEGKIAIPVSIQRETGLTSGQVIELRVVGAGRPKKLVISARKHARQARERG